MKRTREGEERERSGKEEKPRHKSSTDKTKAGVVVKEPLSEALRVP